MQVSSSVFSRICINQNTVRHSILGHRLVTTVLLFSTDHDAKDEDSKQEREVQHVAVLNNSAIGRAAK